MPDDRDKQTAPAKTSSHPYEDVVGTMQLVEMMMQIQNFLGNLASKVEQIETTLHEYGQETKEHRKQLNKIEKIIYACAAVGGTLIFICSVILDIPWAELRALLARA